MSKGPVIMFKSYIDSRVTTGLKRFMEILEMEKEIRMNYKNYENIINQKDLDDLTSKRIEAKKWYDIMNMPEKQAELYGDFSDFENSVRSYYTAILSIQMKITYEPFKEVF